VPVLTGYRRNNKTEVLNKGYVGETARIRDIELRVLLVPTDAHTGAQDVVVFRGLNGVWPEAQAAVGSEADLLNDNFAQLVGDLFQIFDGSVIVTGRDGDVRLSD
jgi:hypothetical protein